jgi:hypothetical protein
VTTDVFSSGLLPLVVCFTIVELALLLDIERLDVFFIPNILSIKSLN